MTPNRSAFLRRGLALAVLLLGVPAAPSLAGDSGGDAGIESPAPPDPAAAPATSEPSAAPATPDPAAPPAATAPAPRPGGDFPANRAISTRKVRLTGGPRHVVRTGPGDRFAIAGVFPGKTVFPVIAKSGDWINVRLSETESGWVHASLCREFDDMADLEFRANPRLYSRTGSYVLSGYSGAYAFDRKSNSLVLGGRLGYYVFDRLQAEGSLGWTHVRRPAEIVESLFGLTLEAEDFHMLFYHLAATYELLPGRQMVPFVSAGVGSSIMQGDTETSVNFGAGTLVFLSRHVAMRWEVRNHQLRFGSEGARRTHNNVEFTLGSGVLF